MASVREPDRILVTGAAGFAGRRLARHLVSKPNPNGLTLTLGVHPGCSAHSLKALAAEIESSASRSVTVCVTGVDIVDAESVRTLMCGARPQQVFHLAGRASGSDSDRRLVLETNVHGAHVVLEAANGVSPCPNVLLISSGYVYGSATRPSREEDSLAPLETFGPYTDSKILMERMAEAYPNCWIARAFSHTGPGQTSAYAIPAFAEQIALIECGRRSPVIAVGNLEAERDVCDVRDVVRAYSRILDCAPANKTFNVCSGRAVPMSAILSFLRSQCAVATTVVQDESRMRPSDIPRSVGDPARIASELQWEPQYTLEMTLADTLDYWRQATTAGARLTAD